MALKTNKSIFYHIPKTGGIWVRKVISLTKMNERETDRTEPHPLGLEKKHTTYEFTSEEDKNGLFSYCFIRHPVGWYKSFWNFRLDREGGPMVRRASVYSKFILDSCWSDDFDEFIDNVIKRVPEGFVTNLYKYYIGENCDKVDFIGKTENMRKDLKIIFKLANEEINDIIIDSTAKRNTSKNYVGEINEETIKKIKNYEKWIINNFYKI